MHNPERVRIGFRFGPFLLDEDTGELYRNGDLYKHLRPQEHKVLVALLERTPGAIKRQDLIEMVWGQGRKEPEGGLKKVIGWLRKDLEDSARRPQFIQVLPRVGLRFIAAVERFDSASFPPSQIPTADPTISDSALLLVVGPDMASRRMKTILAKSLRECRGLGNSETFDQIVSLAKSEVAKVREEASNSPFRTERDITMAVAGRMETILDEWTLRTEKNPNGSPLELLSQVIDEWTPDLRESNESEGFVNISGADGKPSSRTGNSGSQNKQPRKVVGLNRSNREPQLQVPIDVLERGNFVWDCFFSNDSTRLCICGPEKQIRVYAMPTCELVATLNHKGPVQHLVCHPKRDLVVSLAFNHSRPKASDRPDSIHVWDLRTQKQLNVRVHQKGAEGLVISPSGAWLISIGHLLYNRSVLWKFAYRKGTLEHTSRFEYNGVIDAAFSPIRELIALAGVDGTVRVLNLPTMVEHARLEHYDEVIKVVFSSNGERIATASKDFSACLWDTASGHKLARFGHKEMLCDVAFSPDDQWVGTAADDFACIWNVSTGKEVCRLLHEGRGALKLAFSPTRGYVATGGSDSTVRIWRVPSGQEIAVLHHEVYAGELSHVAFSSDGQLVVTGGGRDGVAVWAVPE